jgi:hypothetical protein
MPNVCRDNEIYTAVRCLLEYLPQCLCGRWLVYKQLHSALKRGGFPGLPEKVLINAMKGARCHRDKFQNTKYYLFGDSDHIDNAPNCYKAQRETPSPQEYKHINVSHFLKSIHRTGNLGKAVERLRLAGYTKDSAPQPKKKITNYQIDTEIQPPPVLQLNSDGNIPSNIRSLTNHRILKVARLR